MPTAQASCKGKATKIKVFLNQINILKIFEKIQMVFTCPEYK